VSGVKMVKKILEYRDNEGNKIKVMNGRREGVYVTEVYENDCIIESFDESLVDSGIIESSIGKLEELSEEGVGVDEIAGTFRTYISLGSGWEKNWSEDDVDNWEVQRYLDDEGLEQP